MGRILYIFPHPDDESFGPAPALARQRQQGHDVHLLTLTRGEATSQREVLGFSKPEMGAVRYREMQDVARVLELSSLTVLDFPDGGLDALSPLELEEAIRVHVEQVRPDVLVTYPVHGVSGHPDHLVTHAVVKRVFSVLRGQPGAPRRLAFFTLPEAEEGEERPAHLKSSPAHAIDCVEPVRDEDLQRGAAALDCYKTYRRVVEQHQPLRQVRRGVCFECFGETCTPRLTSLFERLPPA